MIAHAFTGAGFGFHGDELQFMDGARHLAWGYVAYPPMTPFFARLSLDLFGTSIAGFRFFASLAQALAVILTGLMAREMGGGVRAQVLAGAAQVPYALGAGALMVYNSFDNICWVLAAWFVIKLLRSGDARWWVAVGAAAGFGMMAKYAMAFFAAANRIFTLRRTEWLLLRGPFQGLERPCLNCLPWRVLEGLFKR